MKPINPTNKAEILNIILFSLFFFSQNSEGINNYS